ncbi:MAG: tetratricopeptide repeat protein [Vicinamibacterales bacterium]
MDVARQAGLRVEGVNFPGHFLVRVHDGAPSAGPRGLLVDPFNEGAILTEQDCRELLARNAESMPFSPDLLVRATRRQMFQRMLVNLKRLYVQQRSFPQARIVTEALLQLSPGSLAELRDRGLLAFHLNEYAAALRDLEVPAPAHDHGQGRRPQGRGRPGLDPREVAAASGGSPQLTRPPAGGQAHDAASGQTPQ